jgi:hypothetical protein
LRTTESDSSFSSGFAPRACSLSYQISLKFRYTSKDSHNHFTSVRQEPVDTGSISAATLETYAGDGAPPQLVFALGKLGFDFGTEARRDSITQHMDPPANPDDPSQLLAYCEKNPWDGTAILWTFNLDATPIYTIQAHGAFAQMICQRIYEFLGEQTRGEIERVSIPGYIRGTARLSNGQVVPVIWPDLRGMYSWNTKALVESVCGKSPAETGEARRERRIYQQGAGSYELSATSL